MLKTGLLMTALAGLACGTQGTRTTSEANADTGAAGALVAPSKPEPANTAAPAIAQPTARPEASAGASPVVPAAVMETPSAGGYGGAEESEQPQPTTFLARADGEPGAGGSGHVVKSAAGSAGLGGDQATAGGADSTTADNGGLGGLSGHAGQAVTVGGLGGFSAGAGGTTQTGPCDGMCAEDQICEDDTCVWCPAGQAPVDGTCVCPGETPSECGSRCVDLTSDSNNCGSCGAVCGSGEVCTDGQCEDADGCVGSLVLCGDECVHLATDRSNCGACWKRCIVNSRIVHKCDAGCCVQTEDDTGLCNEHEGVTYVWDD